MSLLYFRGEHLGNSVELEWATATELDTAYFFLERSNSEGGPYQMLEEIGYVPSEAPPDGLSGAEYQQLDTDNVLDGQAYWYILVEVENTQGVENRTQPIRVAVADSQSTPTATATRQATPTPTETSTGAAPTMTPRPSATGTNSPSNSTSTTSAFRTPVIDETNTPTSSQNLASANTPTTTISGAGTGQALAALQSTAETGSYPPPTTLEANTSEVTSQSAYPPAPPTPLVAQTPTATAQYPAPSGPSNIVNGTPVPNIGSESSAPDGIQSSIEQQDNTSPVLGTLFLWLGFLASFIVFLSAVAGAIYYYSRRRVRS